MDKEFLNEIIAGMIEQKRAVRLSNGRIGLLWKSPSEWAQMILQWVDSVGGRDGSVYTLYELIQGDDTQRQPFHGLPESICKLAVAELERSGKARLISSSPTTPFFENGHSSQDNQEQDYCGINYN